jgi:hypothetical protein
MIIAPKAFWIFIREESKFIITGADADSYNKKQLESPAVLEYHGLCMMAPEEEKKPVTAAVIPYIIIRRHSKTALTIETVEEKQPSQ